MERLRIPLAALTASALALGAVGASASPAAAKSATVTINLHDSGCPKKINVKAGATTFKIKNVDASSVSEFEVLKGDKILGEKENLSPGLSGSFSLTLKAGTYTTYCPGGDREHGKLIVKGSTNLEATKAGECRPVGDLSTATSHVKATLDEWVISLEPSVVAAGVVGIEATNEGKKAHEIVVLRGVQPNAIPLDENGALEESNLPPGALVGEIEPFAAGTQCSGVFTLEPGSYVLVCNVTNKAKSPKPVSHLHEGMLTILTVSA